MKANELWHGQEVAVYSRQLGIYDSYNLPRRAVVCSIGVAPNDGRRSNLLNEVKLIPQLGQKPTGIELANLPVTQVDGRSIKGLWSDYAESVQKKYEEDEINRARDSIRKKVREREQERKAALMDRVKGLLGGLGIETHATSRYILIQEMHDVEKLERILSVALLRQSTDKLHNLNTKEKNEEV